MKNQPLTFEGALWMMGRNGADVIVTFGDGTNTFDLRIENPSGAVQHALSVMNDGVLPYQPA